MRPVLSFNLQDIFIVIKAGNQYCFMRFSVPRQIEINSFLKDKRRTHAKNLKFMSRGKALQPFNKYD